MTIDIKVTKINAPETETISYTFFTRESAMALINSLVDDYCQKGYELKSIIGKKSVNCSWMKTTSIKMEPFHVEPEKQMITIWAMMDAHHVCQKLILPDVIHPF